MHYETVTVKSSRTRSGEKLDKQRVVAEFDCEQYDSLEEAVEAWGEGKVLELFNSQYMTNKKNEARAQAVGGLNKTQLRMKAMLKVTQDPELTQEFVSYQGDETRANQLIERVMEEIAAELGQQVPEDAGESNGEGDEEDDS